MSSAETMANSSHAIDGGKVMPVMRPRGMVWRAVASVPQVGGGDTVDVARLAEDLGEALFADGGAADGLSSCLAWRLEVFRVWVLR